MKYYLRLEGVNLSNFAYDTVDLSTVRGGGLLLLDSTKKVEEELSYMKPISMGASSGIFEFDADDKNKAEAVRDHIIDLFNNDEALNHATFVVDVAESSGNEEFVKDRERVIALNRWRQMQSPSVAVPSSYSLDVPCEIDMVRPACQVDGVAGEKKKISDSVFRRREYGKKNKKKGFYERLTGLNPDRDFSHDFSEIADEASEWGRLNGKMAVIYVDGNKFGKIQDEKCTTAILQRDFDKTLQDYGCSFLRALLEEKVMKDEGWLSKEGRYRMETLLWGGDEKMWVFPAWKGWDILAFFYEKFKVSKFKDKNLTYAGGIVFCHNTAPIHRIKDLARSLAEQAKRDRPLQNSFEYEVLESFDHIGRDLQEYRSMRLPYGFHPKDLNLRGETMRDIAEHIRVLKTGEFPTSRMHTIVRGMLSQDSEKRKSAGEEAKRFQNSCDNQVKNALEGLSTHGGGSTARWLHIANLWDYIVVRQGG
jgi:hypothetical protein